MTTTWSFDKEQIEAIEKYVAQDKTTGGLGAYLDASDTGAGKSDMSSEVAYRIGANTVLLIAPLNTQDGWEDAFENRTTLPFYVIDSSDQGKANHAALKRGDRGVYYVTREFFALSATSVDPKLKLRKTNVPTEGLTGVFVNGEMVKHNPQTGLVQVDAEKMGLEPETTYTVIAQYRDGTTQEFDADTYFTKGRERLWTWSSCNRKLDMVILDEGHSMSNRNATGYKVLKQLAPRKLKGYLSATPFRADFGRAWAPTRWLWPDLIDKSQARWGAEWAEYGFNAHKGRDGGYEIIGEKNPGAFVQSLPCFVRIKYEKKPVELHKIRCRLTPEQEKQYTAMLKNAFIWLDENPLVADLPIVQKTRLRQMLLGEVTFNKDGEVDFADDCASDKIDKMIRIARKHEGESIVYFTDSKKFAKVAARRLTEAGEPAVSWTGDVSKAKRREIKRKFVAGDPEVKHIVAVAAAIGEGSNGLQARSHIDCWANLPYDPVIKTQADGRLNRRGQDADKIIRYELVVPDSVDIDDIARDLRKTRGMYGTLEGE